MALELPRISVANETNVEPLYPHPPAVEAAAAVAGRRDAAVFSFSF
jgi:hypothetical protein